MGQRGHGNGKGLIFSMKKHTEDEIEKNEMGWACSKYGDVKRRIQIVVREPE